jgi:hypothetical protein
MAVEPIDDGDAKSRAELRKYRTSFRRGSKPESFYLSGWIPRPSHTSTPWDGFVAVLGAIMLIGIIAGIVAAYFWK